MDFQQARFSIDLLIKRIRTGRLALPDFQRDFVWNPSQVAELLDSVARQWPIGSLLLLTGPQPFAFRAVDAGPRIDSDELDLYILDGQQRVTALYHAIADVSEYCYYIDFSDSLEADEVQVKWERRHRFERQYGGVQARASASVALVADLCDNERFYAWLKHVETEASRSEFLKFREQRLSGLQSNVYTIMAIVLDQSIELEALARIFETLNRTGVALNAFDLMVAALYPTGFGLRESWDEARDRFPTFVTFEPKGFEVLRLIALLVRIDRGAKASKGIRQGDVLGMAKSHVSEYWDEACHLLDAALRYSHEKFGVSNADVVPSWTLILGVACGLKLGLSQAAISEWWLHTVIRQTHAQAANTKIVADVDAMKAGNRWTVPAAVLDGTTVGHRRAKPNGLLLRGLAGLTIWNGGLDPLTGSSLSEAEGIAFRALDAERRVIRRLDSLDDIDVVLLLSASSDKRLPRELSWNARPFSLAAIESQGFDPETRVRRPGFFGYLISELGGDL